MTDTSKIIAAESGKKKSACGRRVLQRNPSRNVASSTCGREKKVENEGMKGGKKRDV